MHCVQVIFDEFKKCQEWKIKINQKLLSSKQSEFDEYSLKLLQFVLCCMEDMDINIDYEHMNELYYNLNVWLFIILRFDNERSLNIH